MKIPLPISLTRRVAIRATHNSRQYGNERGWRAQNGLYPYYGPGYAGVKSRYNYLMYQERGIKPFLMTALEGKTVPIKDPDGKTRFIKVKGVGQPGFVTLPGGIKVWRDQKWRHPGLKPKHFMLDGLEQAIEESRQEIGEAMVKVMGGKK